MDLEGLAELPSWDWPRDAVETILAELVEGERGAPGRLQAAELAGEISVMDDRLAEALLAVVRDPTESERVRGTAAISLGPVLEELDMDGGLDFDDPVVSASTARRIRETLREVYLDPSTPKDVRRRTLEASVRSPEHWHAGAIRAAYHDNDESWRLTAVFGMRFVAGFEDEIVEALASLDPLVRYEAVQAVGSWRVEAAWPVIRDILVAEGGDRDLLLAAIEAVTSLHSDPELIAEALSPLAESPDPEIAEAVLDALLMAHAPWAGGEDDEPDGPWMF